MTCSNTHCQPPPPRGGLPLIAHKGGVRPEGVCERVGISLVEVYKRVGKSVIWVCETV